jgi:hypothetical protein
MKTQLRIGSDQKTLSAISFKRAYLLIQKIPNVPGTSSNLDLDLTKLRCSIDIQQGNVKDSTSFDAVAPTVLGALRSANSTALTSIGFNPSGLTCQGVASSSNTLFTLEVPLLHGGYIVKAEDKITFNIDIIPGFFSSDCDASSSVYLVIEPDSDIQQIDVNLPVYYPITQDKNSPSYNEKQVSEVYLIDSARYTYATAPFQSIEVKSSYVNDRFDTVTLEQKRFHDLNQVGVHGNSLISNVEPSSLCDVELNLGVNTSNVVTGAQFCYVSRCVTSAEITNRAIRHNKKVSMRKAQRRGLKA